MPTALWTVQAALVDIYTAAVDPGVKVHRGPRTRTATQKKYVLVGTDGGSDGVESGDDSAMTAQQTQSDLGPGAWRDETGRVACAVWVWTGSSKAEIPRADAESIYEACEAAVYADRTLRGLAREAEVADLGIREVQTNGGPVVRVAFTVDYLALITT